MRLAQCLVALALLSNSSSGFAEEFDWISIGKSGMGPWQMYIDSVSIRTDEDGHVRVTVLDDHRVTQMGIDRVNNRGEMYYDTKYKPRSTITEYVLDCENQREVSLRTRYFDGDMGKGRLLLDDLDSEPFWTDFLFMFEERMTKFACKKGKS